MEQIEITNSAAAKIADILAEENNPKMKLRTFVQGGGCAGFQYGFTLDEEQNEDDFIFQREGMTLVIDAMSMQYLQGAKIDYKEELLGSNFTIINPNASTQCGCGSSFGI